MQKIKRKKTILLILALFLFMPINKIKANHNFAFLSLVLHKSTFFDPKIITFDLNLKKDNLKINALEAGINYDFKKLKLIKTSSSTSMCNFFVSEKIDNVKGNYQITCGTDDENNLNTNIITLTFEKLEAGVTQIKTRANSQAALGDGLGTQIPILNETHNIYILK